MHKLEIKVLDIVGAWRNHEVWWVINLPFSFPIAHKLHSVYGQFKTGLLKHFLMMLQFRSSGSTLLTTMKHKSLMRTKACSRIYPLYGHFFQDHHGSVIMGLLPSNM